MLIINPYNLSFRAMKSVDYLLILFGLSEEENRKGELFYILFSDLISNIIIVLMKQLR